MPSTSNNQIDILKQVLIFNEFNEDELAEVAERLNLEFVGAGKVIFRQGTVRENIYIIAQGNVRATRIEEDGSETFLANFEATDIFGEDALMFKRKGSATVTAITDCDLFYLSEADFNWLRRTYPKVEPYLVALTSSHETLRRLKIKWPNPEETVSLVTRRHPLQMIMELVGIAFLVSFTITISMGIITFLDDAGLIILLSIITAGVVTFIGLLAGIWSFFEWRNDYFFVTNLRVVWRERILFRSASRQEVPLRAIQSLDVRTANVFTRMIDVGELIVRTFNNQMVLTHVSHPDRMKDMVDAFLRQARKKSEWAEVSAIRQTIRQRFGYEGETQTSEEPPATPATLDVQKSRRGLSIFRARIVEEGIITYRKHWWIFFLGAWKPSLGLLISGITSLTLTKFTLTTFGKLGLLVSYVIPFFFLLWWLYEYEDWRNDIYKITKDRIIDREKKPFGKESYRSAPIKNIQSVGHEIPNTIGLILNVGNVNINVAEETFTFDGVHDPALVHQDISRRMEELVEATEQDRLRQEHKRMATWLEIFYEETQRESGSGDGEHIPDFD